MKFPFAMAAAETDGYSVTWPLPVPSMTLSRLTKATLFWQMVDWEMAAQFLLSGPGKVNRACPRTVCVRWRKPAMVTSGWAQMMVWPASMVRDSYRLAFRKDCLPVQSGRSLGTVKALFGLA